MLPSSQLLPHALCIGIFTTVLVTIVGVHAGNVCLHCSSVSHPQFCTSVAKCQDNEFCFIDQHVIGGQVTYSLGCRRHEVCSANNTILHHSQSDVRNCTHCCHGNLCNANGCHQKAYQNDRGPICYNCNVMTSPGGCDQIAVCGRDSACLLSTDVDFVGGKAYSASCQMKVVCNAIHASATALGKRNSHQERHLLCTKCCENDLCNDGCDSIAHQHQQYCLSNPCAYGSCSNTSDGYTCTCNEGFTGKNCDLDLDECTENPCPHGVCSNTFGGFICDCYNGYRGKYCNETMDPCHPSPCNSGVCHSQSNGSYRCECPAGYVGHKCEIDIDECMLKSNCVNGFCHNTPGSYHCVCHSGFVGPNCSHQEHRTETSLVPTTVGTTSLPSSSTVVFALTTTDSCKDLTATSWCEMYKSSCYHKTIAYHCPRTCRIPGCPGPTQSPRPSTTGVTFSGSCIDTVENCAFIHSIQPGFCYSNIDYARVHCRQFCRFC